ncbi:unnamed protein product [Closterium sp. NIES-65]|nr:unnamed protein product [Closterium sp. NIES-65]
MAIPLGHSRNATADAKKLQIADALRYPVCPRVRGRVRVNVGMDTVGTVWKGWGTSLAWSGRYIGGLPVRRREYLLDLLFHARKGLGLTIARYSIPGGYDPRYSPRLAQRDVFRGYSSARGRYNWTGDWRQVEALRGAKQRGVEVFDAVCDSPPWWMTKSNDTAGNADGQPNINPDYFDSYAEYVARVVWHLQNDLGIEFRSVSPFNEPLEPWWVKGGAREGCAMSESDIVQVMGKLRPRLQQYGLGDVFVAGVDSWPSQTFRAMSRVFAQNRDKWDQLNVHGYRSPARMTQGRDERQFRAIRDAARRLGKPLWQTERVAGVFNVTAIRDSVTTFVWDNVAVGDDYTPGIIPSWKIY